MSLILNAVYLCALGMLSPWLAWRSVRTGRYRRGLAAKLFGRVSVPNPGSRPVTWFHGVSVGEIHLLGPVVAGFRLRHPGYLCVVSATTDTGLAEARGRFPDCVVIAWPFDFSWAVAAAIASVNPRIVILAEAEMWPNFLATANARDVPVVVVNARLSPKSFGRYRRVAGPARKLLFDRVAVIATQAEEYADRFAKLGVPAGKLRVTGGIKYDGAAGDRDTPAARRFRQLWPAGGLTLVAGSTHPPEEELVLAAFAALRVRFPELRLILVPRHPDRFPAVAKLLAASGLPFERRSGLAGPATAAVLLLDTVGDLGAAWAVADVGYVGGTFDGRRGGQSMIEPAGYGVPTVFGPHVWNFRDAASRLVASGGATMLRDPAELAPVLAELLADPARRATAGAAARALVVAQQGATARTLDVLDGLLPPANSARNAA